MLSKEGKANSQGGNDPSSVLPAPGQEGPGEKGQDGKEEGQWQRDQAFLPLEASSLERPDLGLPSDTIQIQRFEAMLDLSLGQNSQLGQGKILPQNKAVEGEAKVVLRTSKRHEFLLYTLRPLGAAVMPG